MEYRVQKSIFENSPPRLYQTQKDPGLQFGLFEYFPEAHYRQVLDDTAERNRSGKELFSDGSGKTADQVYFWYDPLTNSVIQEEIEPGIWAGFFDQREEAVCYLEASDDISIEQAPFLELYEADIDLQGRADQILEDD